jgi:hypothetical protein
MRTDICFLYTINSVYKGHSREHEKVTYMSMLPFIYRLTLYALFINMRLPFIDSDLLYKGAL